MATFLYFIKEGTRGLFQAKLMTFVSIVTIAIALLLSALLAVGLLNVRIFFDKAADRADIVVYVNDPTASDTAELSLLAAAVRALPQVKTLAVVDKTAALDRLTAMYGSEMVGSIDENPLPLSFEVTLKKEYLSPLSVADIKNRIEILQGVEAVRYAGEWMEFLSRFRKYFYTIALTMAIVMFVTLHITISNSIKLTIYARKELVKNMRFVGATPIFIAMPFIFEGMLQGLFGGGLGITAFLVLKTALRHLPVTFGPLLLPASMLSLGVFFGLIGSFAAVRKFLT